MKNFKKDGTDPSVDPGEQGRFAWTGGFNFGAFLMQALGLALPGTSNGQPEDQFRYRRSGHGHGQQARPAKRRNMLHVSKRVRRKHRRAA